MRSAKSLSDIAACKPSGLSETLLASRPPSSSFFRGAVFAAGVRSAWVAVGVEGALHLAQRLAGARRCRVALLDRGQRLVAEIFDCLARLVADAIFLRGEAVEINVECLHVGHFRQRERGVGADDVD